LLILKNRYRICYYS